MSKPLFTIRLETNLKEPLAGIARAITTLGVIMSELTDSVDAALEAFLANEADEDLRAELQAQTIASLEATIADLQSQIDGGAGVNQENVDELNKVLEALRAATPPPAEPTPDEPDA